jgi:hypothetical protein
MDRTIPIREVVATRDLEFIRKDGRKEPARVSIGLPIRVDSAWCCPYLIKSESFERLRHAVGEDSMQALILCTQIISAELSTLAHGNGGTFTHFGQNKLNFPLLPGAK